MIHKMYYGSTYIEEIAPRWNVRYCITQREKMKQGQISLSPLLIPHVYRALHSGNCMSSTVCWLQLYGRPLFDKETVSGQQFSPPTIGPSSISQRHQAVKLSPPALATHHSAHSPCCLLTYRPTCLASPLLPNHYDTLTEWLWAGQDFREREQAKRKEQWGGLTGREKVAKSAIMLHFQGGKKSHHWLNHLYNIRWFQQFHLMRKSTLSL